MKYCNKCKVNVAGSREKCPLCQNELAVLDENGNIEKFPIINKKKSKIDFVWRLYVIISIFIIFLCSIINYELPHHGLWCRFVVGGVITSWIFLFVLMKKYKNLLKCLFYETVVVSCFVVIWDYCTGMNGWSIDFVLPILFVLVIVAMSILSKVLKIGPEEHLVYLLCLITFGIVSGILWANNVVNIELPSMICMGVSSFIFFGIVVFEGRKIWEEFKKRLHI